MNALDDYSRRAYVAQLELMRTALAFHVVRAEAMGSGDDRTRLTILALDDAVRTLGAVPCDVWTKAGDAVRSEMSRRVIA